MKRLICEVSPKVWGRARNKLYDEVIDKAWYQVCDKIAGKVLAKIRNQTNERMIKL